MSYSENPTINNDITSTILRCNLKYYHGTEVAKEVMKTELYLSRVREIYKDIVANKKQATKI